MSEALSPPEELDPDSEGYSSGSDDETHQPQELSPELVAGLVKQIEFYFSDANLPTDKKLLKQIKKDPEGFVPVKLFANFRKVRSLTKDVSVITNALKSSLELVLSDDCKKVKRKTPVPDYDIADIQRRTIIVEHLPPSPTIESVTEMFSAYGKVKLVRICSKESKGKLPTWLTAACHNITQQHAYVEFENEESTIMATAALHEPDDWRNGLQVRRVPVTGATPALGLLNGRPSCGSRRSSRDPSPSGTGTHGRRTISERGAEALISGRSSVRTSHDFNSNPRNSGEFGRHSSVGGDRSGGGFEGRYVERGHPGSSGGGTWDHHASQRSAGINSATWISPRNAHSSGGGGSTSSGGGARYSEPPSTLNRFRSDNYGSALGGGSGHGSPISAAAAAAAAAAGGGLFRGKSDNYYTAVRAVAGDNCISGEDDDRRLSQGAADLATVGVYRPPGRRSLDCSLANSGTTSPAAQVSPSRDRSQGGASSGGGSIAGLSTMAKLSPATATPRPSGVGRPPASGARPAAAAAAIAAAAAGSTGTGTPTSTGKTNLGDSLAEALNRQHLADINTTAAKDGTAGSGVQPPNTPAADATVQPELAAASAAAAAALAAAAATIERKVSGGLPGSAMERKASGGGLQRSLSSGAHDRPEDQKIENVEAFIDSILKGPTNSSKGPSPVTSEGSGAGTLSMGAPSAPPSTAAAAAAAATAALAAAPAGSQAVAPAHLAAAAAKAVALAEDDSDEFDESENDLRPSVFSVSHKRYLSMVREQSEEMEMDSISSPRVPGDSPTGNEDSEVSRFRAALAAASASPTEVAKAEAHASRAAVAAAASHQQQQQQSPGAGAAAAVPIPVRPAHASAHSPGVASSPGSLAASPAVKPPLPKHLRPSAAPKNRRSSWHASGVVGTAGAPVDWGADSDTGLLAKDSLQHIKDSGLSAPQGVGSALEEMLNRRFASEGGLHGDISNSSQDEAEGEDENGEDEGGAGEGTPSGGEKRRRRRRRNRSRRGSAASSIADGASTAVEGYSDEALLRKVAQHHLARENRVLWGGGGSGNLAALAASASIKSSVLGSGGGSGNLAALAASAAKKEGQKKLTKKDYAAWAAATPEYRAAASAPYVSGGGGSSAGGGVSSGGSSAGGALSTRSSVAGGKSRMSAGGVVGTDSPHHTHSNEVLIARGPDGGRGFMGRGKPLQPPVPA